jgi:hypothetical protein
MAGTGMQPKRLTCDLRSMPIELLMTPLPTPEITPPLTRMYFVCEGWDVTVSALILLPNFHTHTHLSLPLSYKGHPRLASSISQQKKNAGSGRMSSEYGGRVFWAEVGWGAVGMM